MTFQTIFSMFSLGLKINQKLHGSVSILNFLSHFKILKQFLFFVFFGMTFQFPFTESFSETNYLILSTLYIFFNDESIRDRELYIYIYMGYFCLFFFSLLWFGNFCVLILVPSNIIAIFFFGFLYFGMTFQRVVNIKPIEGINYFISPIHDLFQIAHL